MTILSASTFFPPQLLQQAHFGPVPPSAPYRLPTIVSGRTVRSSPCHPFRPTCSRQVTFPLATVTCSFSSSPSSSPSTQPVPSVNGTWEVGQRSGGLCLPHSPAGIGPAPRTTARGPVSLPTSTPRLESTSWPTSPCGQARGRSRCSPATRVLSLKWPCVVRHGP